MQIMTLRLGRELPVAGSVAESQSVAGRWLGRVESVTLAPCTTLGACPTCGKVTSRNLREPGGLGETCLTALRPALHGPPASSAVFPREPQQGEGRPWVPLPLGNWVQSVCVGSAVCLLTASTPDFSPPSGQEVRDGNPGHLSTGFCSPSPSQSFTGAPFQPWGPWACPVTY